MTKFGPGSYYDYLGYTIAEDAINNSTQYQDESGQYQDELAEQQDVLDEIRKDIARKKAIQEYQAWIEEFIYKFSKVVTNILSGSKDPVNDYDVITSFLDIINKNSLDTSRIRGLENKSAFEEVFSKAQNLFDELEKKPEVQNHKHYLHKARLEEERKKELARSEQLRKQDAARLAQKSQAEKSRLRRLREQKERQLLKEQIVAASEALVTRPRESSEALVTRPRKSKYKESSIVPKIIVVLGVIILISVIIAYSY